jgi:integrase
MLIAERDKLKRIVAGVPEGATVDLSLVKLDPEALMFPNFDSGNFTLPRSPRAVSTPFKYLCRKIDRKNFGGLRFHDLRGSHETMLLDSGVPVHIVAERCGHDPAMLLRVYAKKTKGADEKAASTMGTALAGAS